MKVFQLNSVFIYSHISTKANPGLPIPFLNTLFSPPPTFAESLCFSSSSDDSHLYAPLFPGCFSSPFSSTLMPRWARAAVHAQKWH